MYVKFFSVVAAVLVIAGCSSTAQNAETGRAVSVDKVVDQSILNASAGKATVTIARDAFFVASRSDVDLYIDGSKAAVIPNGQVLRFYLPQGSHRIGIKQSASEGSAVKYEEIRAESGGRYDYRLTLNGEVFQLIRLY